VLYELPMLVGVWVVEVICMAALTVFGAWHPVRAPSVSASQRS